MKILNYTMRGFAAFLLSIALAAAAHAQEKPLSLKVYTGDENGFLVTSTLVMGEKDAILVDAQFNLSNAHRVVADVLESGKTLRTVYITHGHPDHYFGLEVIMRAFPRARIVAKDYTVAELKKTAQGKIDTWSKSLGANGPKAAVIPEVLAPNHLELEGRRLELIGPVQGDDGKNSVIWIPSIKALLAGDTVFGGVHAWTADSNAEQRKAWLKTLDRLEAMAPQTVVPGHYRAGTPMDATAIRHTRDYLQAFDQAAAPAANGAALIAAMRARFPDATLGAALEIGAKVNKGEMKW
jgi:glyoxylase-like metal-dependent hydrolase (beta-lactamase superfamily II)